MRYQKIRGHARKQLQIENWRLRNLEFRFDLLKEYDGDHVEIIVHPWCDLSIIKSSIPEPKGKTKQLMLSGLIDIYDSWKVQLNKIGKPYCLKIWLFEQRFSKSRVVCAIGDNIALCENNFYSPDNIKEFNSINYGYLSTELEKFSWECKLDEDCYNNTIIMEPDNYVNIKDYEETKKWFNHLIKKSDRIRKYGNSIDNDIVEDYCFERGRLWIGERK